MSVGGSDLETSGDGQRQLREREVDPEEPLTKRHWYTDWTQVVIALTAIVVAAAGAFAAYEAHSAVGVAKQAFQEQVQQDVESQLATAVAALGGTTEGVRVAGVTLLERSVAEQLAVATNRKSRQDAHSLYINAVTVLSTYLRSGAPFAPGAPCPDATSDVTYAADQLKNLLDMQPQVTGLKAGTVAVDLSGTELCNQYWSGIRFDWLAAAYLWKIDLRGANLQNSQWGTAFLVDAHLQCADLSGANLSHANLSGADLRGANLVGAKLPNTLQPAQRVGAITVATARWNKLQCLDDKAYLSP
jgi:hypothetical protein